MRGSYNRRKQRDLDAQRSPWKGHRWHAGEWECLGESTRDKATTGERPRPEVRAKKVPELDGIKPKGDRASLWNKAERLDTEEEPEQERDGEGGLEPWGGTRKWTGEAERAAPDQAGEAVWAAAER